jgi:hypothetical protein
MKNKINQERHRNSRTGPQIAAYIVDRVTVLKNFSATSKYLLLLSEYMASKIYIINWTQSVSFKTGQILRYYKKDKEWHPLIAATFSAWVFPLRLQLITFFFFQNFVPVIFVTYQVSSGYNVHGLLFTRVDMYL